MVINMLAEKLKISKDEALEIFYNSKTYETMAEGLGDMHCMSEYFIRDEIVDELKK